MRVDIVADSLRPYADPSEKARIVRVEHLAYARFETTISHRVEGILDLVFESPEGTALVPWITLDGVMLMEREISPLIWPSWMRWLDPSQCDAIESRIEPWVRSRIVARLENGSGERFFDQSDALRERVAYARVAGWVCAAPSSDVLTSVAPHRYASRFASGAKALVCGAGAANGGALLTRRASSTTVVLSGDAEAQAARRWFGLDVFTAGDVARTGFDLYVGPRDPAVDARSCIELGGEMGAGALRVGIAQPLPLGIMVSFDLDDAPEVGAMWVTTPVTPGRTSSIVEPRSVGGSTGRVALVVREDFERAADADTDAVRVLSQGLEREGFAPRIVPPSHLEPADYDLIHVFGYRFAGAVVDRLDRAKALGIPIALTPYADDPEDRARTQSPNVLAALRSSFDETLRGDYLRALARGRLTSEETPPDDDLAAARRLFALAGVAFVTCAREEERIRSGFGFRGNVARATAYAHGLQGAADVAALVGTGDFVLVRGAVGGVGNQYLIARAAAACGLPLVVSGNVTDAGYYLQCAAALGDLGMWLPASWLSPEEEMGLVSRARVVADVGWSSQGLHRLATAGAAGCAIVASASGYAGDVWGNAVVTADPASLESMMSALRVAWDESAERGRALAGLTAAVCDPFATLVATVAGYQAVAGSPVSP